MLKNYELELIINALKQCDSEFGLSTRDSQAKDDYLNNNLGLRVYDGRVFLDDNILIEKLKSINKYYENNNKTRKNKIV